MKVAFLVCVFGLLASATYTPTLAPTPELRLNATYNSSTLHEGTAPGYDSPFYIANVKGETRYEIGYSWARMIAPLAAQSWDLLMARALKSSTILEDLMGWVLDIIWNHNMSKHTPTEFLEELAGIEQGMADAGYTDKKYTMLSARMAVLSSFPGEVGSNFFWLIMNNLGLGPKKTPSPLSSHELSTLHTIKEQIVEAGLDVVETLLDFGEAATEFELGCTHWGAWASRTAGGELFSGRNLDWLANSGISRGKLITVIHPPPSENKTTHAIVGYAGLWGAITGVSEEGIVTHEAALNSKSETMDGVAWNLRVRYVMENAKTIEEGLAAWNATDNTTGMSFSIGSAYDRQQVTLETNRLRTAVFHADDPREADALMDGKHYGFPMLDAVWRANHGYDPQILADATHPLPYGVTTYGSETRYMLIHNTLKYYQDTEPTPIDFLQAVNISSVAGDKGPPRAMNLNHYLNCSDTGPNNGHNVISVAFRPLSGEMYLAFENGMNEGRSVAACNPYVYFNLTEWFTN